MSENTRGDPLGNFLNEPMRLAFQPFEVLERAGDPRLRRREARSQIYIVSSKNAAAIR